jgi:uncharacterized PurR-regulated membrane protein YhhQ (DUF165 family)
VKTRIGILAAITFVACIVAANYVTTRYGLVPVGFGLTATAGTYFAGLTFVLRDTVQDSWGKAATMGLIVFGAAVSYLVSDPFIALASGVAFLASETADLAVYTPLRKRGYLRAAIASNVVGAVVDTALFLWIAGFGLSDLRFYLGTHRPTWLWTVTDVPLFISHRVLRDARSRSRRPRHRGHSTPAGSPSSTCTANGAPRPRSTSTRSAATPPSSAASSGPRRRTGCASRGSSPRPGSPSPSTRRAPSRTT